MKKQFLALAAGLFVTHPVCASLFFTKDGQGFFSENDALNHGKSLRVTPGEIVPIERIDRDEVAGELTKADTAAVEAAQADAIERAKAVATADANARNAAEIGEQDRIQSAAMAKAENLANERSGVTGDTKPEALAEEQARAKAEELKDLETRNAAEAEALELQAAALVEAEAKNAALAEKAAKEKAELDAAAEKAAKTAKKK